MKNFTKTMIVFWTLIFAQYTSAQCTTTETFNATGSLQNWTVPSGITSITVEAAGADGGNIGGFIGGNGARLVGTFSVVPGEQLQIIAGTRGNNHPGFPTLGSGAGGGGATFVARGNSGFSNFSTENLLLVAGGGGGAGTLSDGEGSDVLSLLPFGFGGLPGVGAILASGGGGTNVNDGGALASPNAALAGDVKVGEGTHIGIGAQVIQGITIGKWCTIGAGAVIIKDVPDGVTVVGNPGREV